VTGGAIASNLRWNTDSLTSVMRIPIVSAAGGAGEGWEGEVTSGQGYFTCLSIICLCLTPLNVEFKVGIY
jgi:hypothetical protein